MIKPLEFTQMFNETSRMSTLIATSVIRGTNQGDSHGGVYLIDLENKRIRQMLDWNHSDIDWQGRGWDRGLRGIAFDGDRVFIAASDELFEYKTNFEFVASYRNLYLKHCHEIDVYRRRLYLTSTGFDSLLGFDLDNNRFSWGLHVSKDKRGYRGSPFAPENRNGPVPGNLLHLNNVMCDKSALYFSGLRCAGLYAYSGRHIHEVASLPIGIHNARPHMNGILFNDTEKNAVRFVPREGSQRVFAVPEYKTDQLTKVNLKDSRIARQAFGRGLCVVSENVIAAGSSPSTITLHNLDTMKTLLMINLTMDVRNAIHGLELWPYEVPNGDSVR